MGGHKRSHLIGGGGSSTNNNRVNLVSNDDDTIKLADTSTTSFVLDLNLPAPVEDDVDYSRQFNFVGPA